MSKGLDPEKVVQGAGTVMPEVESVLSETIEAAQREGIKPAFYAKVNVLNEAIHEIGMGRYQWELFITAGFGWMADNLCKSISFFSLLTYNPPSKPTETPPHTLP